MTGHVQALPHVATMTMMSLDSQAKVPDLIMMADEFSRVVPQQALVSASHAATRAPASERSPLHELSIAAQDAMDQVIHVQYNTYRRSPGC